MNSKDKLLFIFNRELFIFQKFIFFFLTYNFSLSADVWKFNIGYWSGKHNSEIEKRIKLDDLIDGNPDGMSRYDFRFRGGNSSLFPLGLYYYKDFSSWSLVTRFNYFHRSLGYHFNALDTNFNSSNVRLRGAYSSDYELDFGYRKGFFQNKFFITPRLGLRNHLKNFIQNEIIYGGNTLMTTWKGEMNSYSVHPYFGLELQYIVHKNFSLLLDVQAPISGFKPFSNMNYKLQRAGNLNGRTYLEINDSKSAYIYQLSRLGIGVEISFTENWKTQIGFREEQIQVQYPSYRNTPWVIASGGTGENFSSEPTLRYALIENFLDNQNYQRSISSSQKGIYLSTSYQFEVGKTSVSIPSKSTIKKN